MFFEQLKIRCKEVGTSPTALIIKVGLSRGNLTNWKNGTVPSGKILSELATELDCSVDYLLGNTDSPNPTITDLPTELTGARVAFHDGAFDGLDEDDIEMLKQMARVMREKKVTDDKT